MYIYQPTTGVSLPVGVADGGTGATSASITAFNNITGYTAAGATGTTSTNLVFSTSPVFTTPTIGAAAGTSLSLSAATSLTLGTASSLAGSVVYQNATNANTLTIKSGVVSSSYTLTYPTAVGGAGTVLTDAAGNGTLSWATPAGFSYGASISGTTADGCTITLSNSSDDAAGALKLIAGNTQANQVVLANLQLGTSANAMGLMIQGTGSATSGAVGTGKNHLTLWANVNSSAVKVLTVANGTAYTENFFVQADGFMYSNFGTLPNNYGWQIDVGNSGDTNRKAIYVTLGNTQSSTGTSAILLDCGTAATGGLMARGTFAGAVTASSYTGAGVILHGNTDRSQNLALAIGSGSTYATRYHITANGSVKSVPVAQTSGTPDVDLWYRLPGHSGLTAGTEQNSLYWQCASNPVYQWGTGAITNQRWWRIDAPKYDFAADSTITTSGIISLAGAASAESTKCIITNNFIINAGGAVTQTSSAAATYGILNVPAHTVTLTGTTQMTTAPSVAGIRINTITVTDASAITLDACAALYIAAAPLAAGSVTMTKTYSLWLDAGLPRIDSTSANSTTACVFTAASGPAGANTAIQEWFTIDINGTTRYIPCW